MTDNRLPGPDFIRASACFIVLFHHLAQGMSWNVGDGIEWFRVFTHIGLFGVAAFFVLSGFLLSGPFWQALDGGEEMPSFRTYTLRRAARIVPGFWLALTVTFILSFTVFDAKLDGQLILRYLAGFFLVADWHWITWFPAEVNGPLWSIGVEVTSYVMLPFCFSALFFFGKWTGKGWQSRVLWVGVIALAILAHWLFTKFYPIDMRQRSWEFGLVGGAKFWMPRYNPFAFFAMFAIGSLAAGVQLCWMKHRHWIFDIISTVGMGLVIYCAFRQMKSSDVDAFGWLGIPYDFPWVVLTIALILAATPSSVLVRKLLDNRLTRYLATISFGIYVWHALMIALVHRYWSPDFDFGSMAASTEFVMVSSVIAGLTIVIAHCSYYLLERPIVEWTRGRELSPRFSRSTVSRSRKFGQGVKLIPT